MAWDLVSHWATHRMDLGGFSFWYSRRNCSPPCVRRRHCRNTDGTWANGIAPIGGVHAQAGRNALATLRLRLTHRTDPGDPIFQHTIMGCTRVAYGSKNHADLAEPGHGGSRKSRLASRCVARRNRICNHCFAHRRPSTWRTATASCTHMGKAIPNSRQPRPPA